MHIVEATLNYMILMFVTIFTWFIIVKNLLLVINVIVTAVSLPNVTTVGQNVVNMFHVLFIFLLLIWTGWYAYMAHRRESEQSVRVVTARDLKRL